MEELHDTEHVRVEGEEPSTEGRAPGPSIASSAGACRCMAGALGGEDAEPLDGDQAAEFKRADLARYMRASGLSSGDPVTTGEGAHGARSRAHSSSTGTCKMGGANAGDGGTAVLEGDGVAKGKTVSWK